jgi:hypothetical protein
MNTKPMHMPLDQKVMIGGKVKIMKDKNGNRYVRVGKKKIIVKSGITNRDFLKWLINHLKPRRNKRAPKQAKEHAPFVDLLNPSPEVASNPTLLSVANFERERVGLPHLMPPMYKGAPAVNVIPEPAPLPPPPLALPAPKHEAKARRVIQHKGHAIEIDDTPEMNALVEDILAAPARATAAEDAKKRVILERAVAAARKDTAVLSMDALRKLAKSHSAEAEKKYRNSKSDLFDYLLEINDKTVQDRIQHYEEQFMIGHGKSAAEREALNTDQINEIMQPYRPHYLGTIARDEWDKLSPASHQGMSAWIMNTDKIGNPGTHWVAFLMDLDRHTIEYYNSFGDDIPADVLVSVKEFLAKNNPTKQYLKLKVNRIVDQDAKSGNCGWFCCKFIIDRFRGRPWRECTKFDDHVHGEEAIMRWKKEHGEYEYL